MRKYGNCIFYPVIGNGVGGGSEVTDLNFNLGKVEIETNSTRVFNLAALSRASPELSMEIDCFESYLEVKIALTTVKIG